MSVQAPVNHRSKKKKTRLMPPSCVRVPHRQGEHCLPLQPSCGRLMVRFESSKATGSQVQCQECRESRGTTTRVEGGALWQGMMPRRETWGRGSVPGGGRPPGVRLLPLGGSTGPLGGSHHQGGAGGRPMHPDSEKPRGARVRWTGGMILW